MINAWIRRLLPLLLALAAAGAQAHKASDAYLRLTPAADGGTQLRWDIALRDLDAVLDLDSDGDARLTWAEVRAAWTAIDNLALRSLSAPGCSWRVRDHGLEQRGDGAYAVLWLHSTCELSQVRQLQYRLFRDDDPTHRGLLRAGGDDASVILLDPRAGAVELPALQSTSASDGRPQPSLVAEGVRHIVGGTDHVLFLLCLLLPAVMRRTPQGWQPVQRITQAAWPVLAIVTAFTVAHSISLAVAVSGLWLPSPAFIEPAIAVTIVLAAFDNLRPVLGRRRIVVTFLFGLVHGFGFAGPLMELELSPGALAWALLRFNLGIECGQLAIVGLGLAALFALRRWRAYPAWVLQGGSAAAVATGVFWFAQRTMM